VLLKNRYGRFFSTHADQSAAEALSPGPSGVPDVSGVPGVHHATRAETPTTVELKVSLDEEPAIGAVVQALAGGGARILTLKKVEPTLEDVFIELVGHRIDDEEEPADA